MSLLIIFRREATSTDGFVRPSIRLCMDVRPSTSRLTYLILVEGDDVGEKAFLGLWRGRHEHDEPVTRVLRKQQGIVLTLHFAGIHSSFPIF